MFYGFPENRAAEAYSCVTFNLDPVPPGTNFSEIFGPPLKSCS